MTIRKVMSYATVAAVTLAAVASSAQQGLPQIPPSDATTLSAAVVLPDSPTPANVHFQATLNHTTSAQPQAPSYPRATQPSTNRRKLIIIGAILAVGAVGAIVIATQKD